MVALTLCESVATYLAAQGSLGLTLGTNCFYSFIPDAPDAAVVVLERPGAASILTLTGPGGSSGSAPQSLLDQPSLQIRVRDATGNYVPGNTTAQAVWKVLQGFANSTMQAGGINFLLITASNYPAFLGVDTRQRPEWSLNLRTIISNVQRQ
jgi:hypothetical protein